MASKKCLICSSSFSGRRDAKTCSMRCRKRLQLVRISLTTPKKHLVKTLSLFILMFFGVASLVLSTNFSKATAATSSNLNFQSRLLTSTGAVVADGNYNIEFKIYNASSSSGSSQGSCSGDANCLWTETRTSTDKVRVVNGYMSVNLGSVTSFPAINWDQQMYLTMNIGGTGAASWDGEMNPRITLTALPYSFYAGQLASGSGSSRGTLSFASLGQATSITLPDPGAGTATVCYQSASACGFAASSGSGNYIQNTTSVQTSANFNIDTTGKAGVSFLSPLFDAQSSNGALGLGSSNAGAITIGNTTNSTVTVNTKSSTTAFQVQNASARSLLNVDSTGNIVSIGNSTDGSQITLAATGNANGTIRKNMAVGGSVAANDVVVIDTAANGQVKTTTTASDPKVFGVATTTTTPQDIVVSGVYQVNLLATNQAITQGDFLVTTTTAGKVDKSTSPAAGTVLGRALESKTSSAGGTIWVYITPGLGGSASSSTTLAQAYTNGASQSDSTLTLDATRLGVIIKDSSGGIGSSLFTVQNNGGTSKYLDLSASVSSLQTAASGTINIGTDNVASKTINIGSVGSTAQNTTTHIADSSAGVQTVTIGSTNSSSATTIKSGTGSITLNPNGSSNSGVIVQTTNNSTAAFQVQNAASYTLLNFDTTLSVLTAKPFGGSFVGGGDSSGTANTGTGSTQVNGVFVSGRYEYVVRNNVSATNCSSADGCELQVWDVSNPSSPTYKGGADAGGGTNTGTSGVAGTDNFKSVYVSGHFAYVTSAGKNTACSQTAGSAVGCELKVFDVSNPASPTYVGGADASGSTNSGTQSVDMNSVYVTDRYIYVVQNGSATACSQTAGSAVGCELKVFDVTNPSNPTYVSGIDVGGSAAGTSSTAATSVTVSGRYVFISTASDTGACISSGGNTNGCEIKVFDASNPSSISYLGGGDASGTTNSGTTGLLYNSIAVSGRYLYAARNNVSATNCSSANGCELQVWDISTPSSPTYVGGADAGGGTNTGTSGSAGTDNFTSVYVSGRYVYTTSVGNSTACSQAAGSAVGCELKTFDVITPASPAYIGGGDSSGTTNTGTGSTTYNSVFVSGMYLYTVRNGVGGTNCSSADGCELQSWNVGGIDSASAIIHSLESGNLQVDNNASINNQLNIGGSLDVGQSAHIQGNLGVGGYALFQNQTNSTTAFQVQNATGGNLFQVDSTNSNLTVNGANNGLVQAWQTSANTLPTGVDSQGTLVVNGYVYTLGGIHTATDTAAVQYAQLQANGNVGTWGTTTSLPAARDDAGYTTWNGYVYVIGGSTNDTAANAQSTVYYAKVNQNGTISNWNTNSYALGCATAGCGSPVARYSPSAFAYNGYLYLTGGANAAGTDQTTVYYAKINADGSTGAWNTTTAISGSGTTQGMEVFVANGYMYADRDQANWSKINADGTLGSWTGGGSAPTSLLGAGTAVMNGYLYMYGGFKPGGSVSVATTYYAQINSSTGAIGSWSCQGASAECVTTPVNTNAMPLDKAFFGNTTVQANGYMYAIGGTDGSSENTVYYTSTARTSIAGSLDLVGVSVGANGNLAEGDTGGQLTAGDTSIVGTLSVQNQANFNNGVGINGLLGISGSETIQNTSNSLTNFSVQNGSGVNLISSSTVNLIKNSSFESGTTGVDNNVSGWSKKLGSETSIMVQNSNANFGSNSMQIVATTTTQQGAKYLLSNLLPSTQYTFSFYAQLSTAGPMNTLTFGRSDTGVSGGETNCVTTGSLTTTYTRFNCTFTTGATMGASGTPYIYISKGTDNAARTIYIDGVQLEQAAAATDFRNGDITIDSLTTFKSTANSTVAFQIQNAAGSQLLNVDTTTTPNLLSSNPDFEASSVSSWVGRLGTETVARTTSQAWQGNAALSVTEPASAAANAGTKYVVSLSATTTYALSAYVKTQTGSIATFAIGRAEDGATDTNCSSGNTVSSGGWTRLTCTFTTGDTAPSSSYIYIKDTAGNVSKVWYVDGVQLESRANLLTNPGAESALGSEWAALANTNAPVRSTTAGHFNSGAAGIDVTPTTTGTNRGIKSVITLNSFTTYTFSIYARNSSGTAGSMEIGRSEDGAAFSSCSTGNSISASFAQFSCTFTTGATSGSTFVYIRDSNSRAAAAPFYVDTAQLWVGTNSAAAAFQDGQIAINGVINSPATFRNQADSTTAFQIQNASGINYVQVDTSGSNLTFGNTGIATNVTIGSGASTSTTTLQGGTGGINITPNGSSNTGVLIKPTNNSTAVFQVQNATGGNVMQIDSTNSSITVNGANNGQIQSWQTGNNSGLTAKGSYGSVIANGYVYIIGGCTTTACTNSTATVQYAKLLANGNVGNWASTTSMPGNRDDMGVTYANGYIYVVGGSNNDTLAGGQSTVYYTKVNPDGTLGAWNTSSNSLPTASGRYEVLSTAYNGYLYAVGGSNPSTGNQLAVYYAKINADGTNSTWNTTSSLVTPINGMANIAVANGYIYTLSDTNLDGNRNQYAKLNSDGTIGTWATTTALTPTANNVTGGAAAVANGYIYYIGGDSGVGTYTRTLFAQLNANGTIGAWSCQGPAAECSGATQINTTALPADRAYMGSTSMAANGYIYIIGGYDTLNALNNTVYYTSTARTSIGGSLDLLGTSLGANGNLAEGDSGGQLTAGDTSIVGTLNVQNQATFNNSVSVNGSLGVSGSATFQNQAGSTIAFQVQNASGLSNISVTTADLVGNSDFESGSTGQTPSGWASIGTNSTLTVDNTQADFGLNSMKDVTSTNTNAGAKYNYPLLASTQYTLSFYAKVSSGSITDVQAGRADDGATNTNCFGGGQTVTTTWTRFSCTYTTGATISGTPYLYIYKTGASAETFYLDGIQLEQAAAASTYTAGNIKLDGQITFKNSANSTTAFQVQDAGAVNLFAIDTTNRVITISGDTTTFANLTLTNAHFKSTQTTAPTIGTPTNCATSPTATVTSGSSDSAGSFIITTGTGGGQTTCDTVITFNKAYGAAPKTIVLQPTTAVGSATGLKSAQVSATSTTTFTVKLTTNPAGAGEVNGYYYWIVE